MELIGHIEEQIAATRLPLVAITVAAVPCPQTPIILTMHWHGFVRERLADIDAAQTVRFTPIPSSALQVNANWRDVMDLDRATVDAAWALGAWNVARAERPTVMRPGAPAQEAFECLRAFGAFPYGLNGNGLVIRDAPDADELLNVAAQRGYLMWMFRPVHGGIWKEVAEDDTLAADGKRELPCPIMPIRPSCDGAHETVYQLGRSSNLLS